MPLTVSVKTAPPKTLRYGELNIGDVFTWHNGKFWYLKLADGYAALTAEGQLVTDEAVRMFGLFDGVQDLRRASKATLTIEV